MAEYLLRYHLGPHSRWEVRSAGVYATDGSPISENSLRALQDLRIQADGHRSQRVTRELVDAASLIVVMTVSHCAQMQALFLDVGEKLFLLKTFDPNTVGQSVSDPIGSSVTFYRTIRDEIDAALPGLISFLNELDKPAEL
jgi:protein-tyrosine phosphatase